MQLNKNINEITDENKKKYLLDSFDKINNKFLAITNDGFCLDDYINNNAIYNKDNKENKEKCVKYMNSKLINIIKHDIKYLQKLEDNKHKIIDIVQTIFNNQTFIDSPLDQITTQIEQINTEIEKIYFDICTIYDEFNKNYLKMLVLRGINKLPEQPQISFFQYLINLTKKD